MSRWITMGARQRIEMLTRELDEGCLANAAGRVKTMMQLAALPFGAPMFCVLHEYMWGPQGFILGRDTHLIRWTRGPFIKRHSHSNAAHKTFTPSMEIDPAEMVCIVDAEHLVASRKLLAKTEYPSSIMTEMLNIRHYNVPGIPDFRRDRFAHTLHNAIFLNEEDAERYRLWLSMMYEQSGLWDKVEIKRHHKGIMQIRADLVNMKNIPQGILHEIGCVGGLQG